MIFDVIQPVGIRHMESSHSHHWSDQGAERCIQEPTQGLLRWRLDDDVLIFVPVNPRESPKKTITNITKQPKCKLPMLPTKLQIFL